MSIESPREGRVPDSGSILQNKPPRRNTASISGFLISPRWASPAWLLLLAVAVAEVLALWVRVKRVPPTSDYEHASAAIRGQHRPRDAIVIAPNWADPLLRLSIGDLMPPSLVGRFDLSAYERLWVVSMRGARAPEAPPRPPDFRADFGRLTLERYDFAPSPVVADLVALLPQATVEQERAGSFTPCPYRETPMSHVHGGLGAGPVAPRGRFVCDPRRDEAWVGTTLFEDLNLAPRYCVYQHPQGTNPVATTFRDVLLGEELVLYTALYYEAERDGVGAPVSLRVLLDGRVLGTVVHRDGDGALRSVFSTQAGRQPDAPRRGELRIEVTSEDATRRIFCWSGSTRDAARKEAP